MGDFTEDELIATIRRLLSGDAPGVRLGLGDDAALVDLGAGVGVLTADMMVEDVHFTLASAAPSDLGYKALAVNVSDVAAMGGSPRFALVSLGLTPDVEAPWVVELYGGLRDCAGEHGVAIVGGDTCRSGSVVISVALTGEVPEGVVVTRSGARPGDRVVVTGSLGAAAGGLLLDRAPPTEVAAAAASPWGRGLLQAAARPVARVGEGQTLAQTGATAMMDVSDGLSLDLSRLCAASDVGATVRLGALPVAIGLEELRGVLPVDPLQLALGGGEDYELLATLPPEAVPEATTKLRERFGTSLTEIGEIRDGHGLAAEEPDGTTMPLEPSGWDHFAA